MKVLQVGKFYPIRGGVEKVMYDLMIGLSNRGVSCDMLCATTEGYQAAELSIGPYAKVMAMKTQMKFAATMISASMVSKMKNIVHEYDIVHVHHPDPMAALSVLLSGFKGKLILHWHSDILKQKLLLKLYAPLQQWLIRRADLIVGTTPVYVKHSPFLQQVQDKVDFIPIGIQAVQGEEVQVAKLRNQYKGKFLVFSLGRLVEYKGYEYLIRAAQFLDDRFKILIGGKGPLEAKLIQLIQDCGVQDRVELIGYVSDELLPSYYAASDLFCLSSVLKTEAFAIVQLEAMSCGKPVISTDISESGVSWVNAHESSGWVVPIRDEKAIADNIRLALDNPELYTQLAQGARDRYEKNFTQAHMIDRCLQLYNQVLNGSLVEVGQN